MFEESEDFGLLAPEFGVEVEADEFDGFAEALAGWDACFFVLVVFGLAGELLASGMFLRLEWVPVRLPVVLVGWFLRFRLLWVGGFGQGVGGS